MRREWRIFLARLSIFVIMIVTAYLLLINENKENSKTNKNTFNMEVANEKKTNIGENEVATNESKESKKDKASQQEGDQSMDTLLNQEELSISKETIAEEVTTELEALTIVDPIYLGDNEMNDYFFQKKISSSIFRRIDGRSYKENCPIPLDELRYIKLLYYGFDKKSHIGEIIVHKDIAEDVINIFKELYQANYPIEKMQLVDEYEADDILSMEANNSSAFNFRYIDGTTKYSNHAKGLAIDINPLYNPYVRTKDDKMNVLPLSGEQYADRSQKNDYFIRKDDICYKIFIKYGFTWGGEWKNSKDYQHFEKVK